MSKHNQNPWKGMVLGALGGLAGVLAMRAYWQTVTNVFGGDPRKMEKEDQQPQPLDDISLFGKMHEEGESSTAAMGRMIYTKLAGKPPESEETKTALSYIVHWAISMLAGAAYGAMQGRSSIADVRGGAALGTGLWLFGDELVQPLLGFTDGPTAYPPELHVHSWGAHLVYGLSSATATQVLHRLLP